MASNKFSLARGMGGNQPRLEELKLAAIQTAYTGNVVTAVHYVLESEAPPMLTPDVVAALRHVVEFAGIGVGHDQYDSKLQVIKELLAELEADDAK